MKLMKKLFLWIALSVVIAVSTSKAQSVELVKISSFSTGYITGSYDEYPTWWVKIWDKILLNDTYSILNTETKPDGTWYKYITTPKTNLTICIYDADKNEYCDYQNLTVLKTDTWASNFGYPTKSVLQYKGNKLPSMNILAMTWLVGNWDRYISYDPYYTWYFVSSGTITDILWEKIFLNSINPTNSYGNSYIDPNVWIYTDTKDIYKANQNILFTTPKYQWFWLSSLTKGELADLINGNSWVLVSQNMTYDPNFANYFIDQKDQTVIATQNLKLNNTNLTWIKPQWNSYSQDIYTNAKKDYNTSLNITLAWYIWDIAQYERYFDNSLNAYASPETTVTKTTFIDKNSKTWNIVKNVVKYDNNRPVIAYDSPITAISWSINTWSINNNLNIYYYALSTNNGNIITLSLSTISTGTDNWLSMMQDAINNTSIKKNLSFSMPKELAINIIKPQDSNYFVTRAWDSQYPQYNLIHTSTTGWSIYVYKNQYTNVKAYIKWQEKDYSYAINSNNSPMYIKNTKYENINQFDILLPVKEADGTDSTISMSTSISIKSEMEDFKKLLDKALYTTVKITKTKKNAKEFDKNVSNYFKNLK